MAVAEYVARRGGKVFLSELLPAAPNNADNRQSLEAIGVPYEMGGHTKSVYTHAPLVVISPGIPPTSSVITQLALSGVEVISEVEFASRENNRLDELPGSRRAKLIAITGTNGKTTTTTLIAEILTADGQKAPACGNIGWPMLSALDTRPVPDTLVTELSSFQLTFSPTLTADIAVFMNLTPDHINWHGSLEHYKQAKLRLFTGEQSPQWVVINADDGVSQEIAAQTRAKILWFSQHADQVAGFENKIFINDAGQAVLQRGNQPPELLFTVSHTHLRGRHNVDNCLAAAGAAALHGIAPKTITQVIETFAGVEHRLEKVMDVTLNGKTIAVFNDSKATNTDAAISALKSFDSEKVVLIAGGRDKMEDLALFTQYVKDRCSAVVLIGEAKDRFANALTQGGFNHIDFANDMETAVDKAFLISQGETIVFSPAAASFDWYENFEKRGEAFKATVRQWQQSHQPPYVATSGIGG